MKNLTVTKKLILGFGLVLLLLITSTAFGVFGVQGILNNAREVIEGNRLQSNIAQREIDHLNWAANLSRMFTEDDVREFTGGKDPQGCKFGKWYYSEDRQMIESSYPELIPLLEAIEEPHNELHASATAITDHFKQPVMGLNDQVNKVRLWYLEWAKVVSEEIEHAIKGDKIDADMEDAEHRLKITSSLISAFLQSEYAEHADELLPGFHAQRSALRKLDQQFIELSVKVENALAQKQHDQAYGLLHNEIDPALEALHETFEQVLEQNGVLMEGFNKASKIYEEQTLPALAQVRKGLHAITDKARTLIMSDQHMIDAAVQVELILLIGGLIACGLGVFFALWLSRSISNPLKQAVELLNAGADETESAAAQVSSASQSLAEGASEQASSLEETSSSLEEMASMTRGNAQNAIEASKLAEETRKTADVGAKEMEEMSVAMQGIRESSEDISKIIKTIDEIAFQTNLLALNAAVEAARAGEAGQGFAVVADEVRSLAQRSAVAARETAEKIDVAVHRSSLGVDISERVAVNLRDMIEKAQKVDALVKDIAGATHEQDEGIQQINESTNQLDQLTQSNASNAEETASAAEELSAQAEEMKRIIHELSKMVFTVNNESTARPMASQASYKVSAKPAGKAVTSASVQRSLPAASRSKVEDDDFKDF